VPRLLSGASSQRVTELLHRFSASRLHLRDLDVLASGALGTLSSLERDGLSFTEIVETSFATRGGVEEVLVPIICQDETKPFVTDEPFDRAVHGCHGDLLESI
jgi:hypothetical protein